MRAVEEQVASLVTVTCALDSRAHAVPDSELTSDALDQGRFSALCGHVIAAAPLVACASSAAGDGGYIARTSKPTA